MGIFSNDSGYNEIWAVFLHLSEVFFAPLSADHDNKIQKMTLTIDSKSSRVTPNPTPSKLRPHISLIHSLTRITPISVGSSVSDGQEGVGCSGTGAGGDGVARICVWVYLDVVLVPVREVLLRRY